MSSFSDRVRALMPKIKKFERDAEKHSNEVMERIYGGEKPKDGLDAIIADDSTVQASFAGDSDMLRDGFAANSFRGRAVAIERHPDGAVTLCKEYVDDIVSSSTTPPWIKDLLCPTAEIVALGKVVQKYPRRSAEMKDVDPTTGHFPRRPGKPSSPGL